MARVDWFLGSAKAADAPCLHCPWLISNHGKRHPDGWYTKANLRRLWAGLRRGEQMSCHPTDASNPVSPRAQDAGYRKAPESAEIRRCAGAEILVQREIMRLQVECGSDPREYRRRFPSGLTTYGLVALVERVVFGDRARPNLNAPVATADERLTWPLSDQRYA